jgi:hypothetical protein
MAVSAMHRPGVRRPGQGQQMQVFADELAVEVHGCAGSVVEEAEPLQLGLRRLALEPPVPGSLLIGQEPDRHTPIMGRLQHARYR